MKLAIITCVNGSFTVAAEGIETEQAALVTFHNQCASLWNAPDVITGEVAIVDEQLDIYHGCKEFIRHDIQQTTPEIESENE